MDNVGLFLAQLVYFMDIPMYFSHIWWILWTFGVFYGHLVYYMDIWCILWTFRRYILWSFGTCFSALVCCTKKDLATLILAVELTKL
jgi:hypothetical protein